LSIGVVAFFLLLTRGIIIVVIGVKGLTVIKVESDLVIISYPLLSFSLNLLCQVALK
jgi:hypothetical protein